MKNKLLVLTPEDSNKAPSKTLDKDLNVLESYPTGMKSFYFDEIEYENFHQALEKVFKFKNSFIVLGKLTKLGEYYKEEQQAGYRRKKEPKPTIEDNDSTEIVLDLDDHYLEGFDPLDPEPAIDYFLQEMEINCDVTWQITSSQKLVTKENPKPLARIRLFFSCHKRFSLKIRKAWSQMVPESDGSVYTCSQPIYTAPPNVVGKDPIHKRHGFMKGARKTFVLPKLTVTEVENNSSYSRNSNFDFEDKTIPEEVLSGKVYRRYFMPLAFHYANKIQDREAIFYIIAGKAQKVTSREFHAQNVYEYIDDALKHVEREKETLSTQLAIEDPKKEKDPLPKFPKDVMDSWPQPWPMIWQEFKKIPRKLEEPLLVPTILSLNAYFLRAKYVTGDQLRRPNMFYLNLTPSTGNKDVNSKNVIRSIDNIFKRDGKVINMFSGILNAESNITADSTFLQSFSESEEFFWINTEATRIFQQIKHSGSVSSVAALSDKLIEVVDGHEITGKNKATGKVKTIVDPNCQILFYAQPETIEKYIDDEMVDSGLFGRALINIIPNIEIKEEEFSMFKSHKESHKVLSKDFIDFYSSNKWAMADMDKGKIPLSPSEEGINKLDKWAKKEILPHIRENETLYKLLTRLGNSAEQLYCIVLGVCQMWDRINKKEVRKEIDIDCIIPLLRYWKQTKIYSVNNLVRTELDPLSDELILIIEEIISGEVKLSRKKEIDIRKQYKMAPRAQVLRVLGSRKALIRKLDANNDKRNVMERAKRILSLLIENEILIEKRIDKILCIGVMR